MERVAELSNKKSREKRLAEKKTDQGEQKGKRNRSTRTAEREE